MKLARRVGYHQAVLFWLHIKHELAPTILFVNAKVLLAHFRNQNLSPIALTFLPIMYANAYELD